MGLFFKTESGFDQLDFGLIAARYLIPKQHCHFTCSPRVGEIYKKIILLVNQPIVLN